MTNLSLADQLYLKALWINLITNIGRKAKLHDSNKKNTQQIIERNLETMFNRRRESIDIFKIIYGDLRDIKYWMMRERI